MTTLLDLLARQGPELLAGTTLLLGVAALAVLGHRNPIHRQRLGEAGVLTALAFVGLALLPLPRPLAWLAPDALTLAADTPAATEPPPSTLDGATLLAVAAWQERLAQHCLDPARAALDAWNDGSGEPRLASAPRIGMEGHDPNGLGHDRNGLGPGRTGGPALPGRTGAPGPEGETWLAAQGGVEALTRAPARPADPDAALRRPSATPLPSTAAPSGTTSLTPAEALTLQRREPWADEALLPASPWRRVGLVLLTGSVLGLGWLLLGLVRLTHVLRCGRPAPAWLVALMPSGPETRRVRLLVTTARTGPFCVGARRPTIVLPQRLCRSDQADALRAVLLHELGHARAGDGLGRLVLTLALPVLWWHPLFWWLRHHVRLASELRADDHAAAHAGKGRYARRLLDLADRGLAAGSAPLAAPSVFGSTTDLSRRIEMLMRRTDRLAVRCTTLRRTLQTTLATGLLVLVSTALGAAPAAAQDADHALETLRAERAELQAQLAELKHERSVMQRQMAEMRAAVEQMRAQVSEMTGAMSAERAAAGLAARGGSGRGDDTRVPGDALKRIQELEERLAVTEASRSNVLAAQAYSDARRLAEQAAAVAQEAANVDAYHEALRAQEQQLARQVDQLVALGYVDAADAADARDAEANDLWREIVAQNAHAERGGGAGPGLSGRDTLELMERAMDLEALVMRLQVEVARMTQLAHEGVLPLHEAEIAERELAASIRKLELMRTLLRGELEAVQVQIDLTHARMQDDPSARATLVRLHAQHEVISSLFESDGGQAR